MADIVSIANIFGSVSDCCSMEVVSESDNVITFTVEVRVFHADLRLCFLYLAVSHMVVLGDLLVASGVTLREKSSREDWQISA